MTILQDVIDFWREFISQYRLVQISKQKLYTSLRDLSARLPLIVHPWQILRSLKIFSRIMESKVRKKEEVFLRIFNKIYRELGISEINFVEFQKIVLLSLTYAIKYASYTSPESHLSASQHHEFQSILLEKMNAEVMWKILRVTRNLAYLGGTDIDRSIWIYMIFGDKMEEWKNDSGKRKLLYTWAGEISEILGITSFVSYNVLDSRELKELLTGELSRRYAWKSGVGYMMTPTAVLFKWFDLLDRYDPRDTDPSTFFHKLTPIGNYIIEIDKIVRNLLEGFESHESIARFEGISIIDFISSKSGDLTRLLGINERFRIFVERDLFRALYLKLLLTNVKIRVDDLLLNGRLVKK
ncbi:MAG: hypothetical protein ACTSX9_06775 [Candidatus Njordarchaeales archaeon]